MMYESKAWKRTDHLWDQTKFEKWLYTFKYHPYFARAYAIKATWAVVDKIDKAILAKAREGNVATWNSMPVN